MPDNLPTCQFATSPADCRALCEWQTKETLSEPCSKQTKGEHPDASPGVIVRGCAGRNGNWQERRERPTQGTDSDGTSFSNEFHESCLGQTTRRSLHFRDQGLQKPESPCVLSCCKGLRNVT